MVLDEQSYRDILAGYPAGVTVVTATDRQGMDYGLTVSSFCSVSLRPPLILVCIDKGANTLPAIQESGCFTVNILSTSGEGTAMRFASKDRDKFEEMDPESLHRARTGPVLNADTTAYLSCDVEQEVEAGDHIVFIGRVVDAHVIAPIEPLVYCSRAFRELLPKG